MRKRRQSDEHGGDGPGDPCREQAHEEVRVEVGGQRARHAGADAGEAELPEADLSRPAR